ncbi:DUF1403 family protein [Methylocella tundrae]|uniref:DUF1403 family protein n=1 Tax=Methylocella tundrae TaxID=227605 RepID=UPI002ADECC05|nr:DUF1403 family protein [Methylocella tundrae]WPP02711.1 DUF1403 family protein [Methylocella tundrae]
MAPRPRISLAAPPAFPPFPSWARSFASQNSEGRPRQGAGEGRIDARRRSEERGFADKNGAAGQAASGEDVAEAAFRAGAALAALHPIARAEHPLGALWRQRLALACAAVLARQGGRTEDEAALRDAWYLRRDGDDPGPAGRILKAWRRLGEPGAMQTDDWTLRLPVLLELRRDDVFEDVVAIAAGLAKGQGSAVAAAAEIAAVTLRLRPDAEALALWLADAVLAHRLNWPAPVPMIAGEMRRSDLSRATQRQGDGGWLAACSLAYSRAAAVAADRYAELARRAERLLAVAPQLRGKDADLMIAILIGEDAQAARTGKTVTDRSSRRLFDRLVALGAVRELTGRPTFRLYGL